MSAPKLRFKGFEGDWNGISIGKILKIKSGLGFKAEEYTTEEEIRLLQIENVGYGAVKWTHNVKYVPNNYLELHQNLVLGEGDLVLALNRPVTNDQLKIAKLTEQDSPSILYQRVGKLEFIEEKFDSNFIFQIFQKDVKNYVLNSSIGSDQPFISITDLYKHQLNIPSNAEQIKIASFLSAVDKKINQLTQKHELLSQYKQGMMQKLFSQQIRFKADDGSEFGEWEETTIGKITSTISTGATPSTLKEEYWNGNIKWMSSGELNHRHVHDVEKTITELGFKSSSTKILPKRCVLIGLAGQGKTRGTVAINYIELCTNQSIAAIHPNPKVFDYRFIFFNLDMRYQELRALSTGDGGRGGLNLQIIKGVEIHLPCLEEQTKIANFLSSIDQKIEVVAQQIEQAKQWKKGLLQQMFI